MPKISKEEIIKAVERYKRGETSQKAEAKKQGVSHQTFQDCGIATLSFSYAVIIKLLPP